MDDIGTLRELNLAIGAAEDRYDRAWLSGILAPQFAFQRADQKTFDNADAFLQKVVPPEEAKPPRVTQIIEPIVILGDRAVVQCLVIVGKDAFHNLRLFVRHEGAWKLLAWANDKE